MTTENIIYKPLRDTESQLVLRLANGEFGFATDSESIVFKSGDGSQTTVFRNPDSTEASISTGATLPTAGINEGAVFILNGSVNSGLYRYTLNNVTAILEWVQATPLATTTVNGRLEATDKIKIDNIETTATGITNTLVPVITSLTGGKLSDSNAVKFNGIETNAQENVQS